MEYTINASKAVPENSAPPIPTYPQFYATQIPRGSGAQRAFRGYIRPFSDDDNARRVLRALTADRSLSVSGGRLDSSAEELPGHPAEPFLTDMAVPCTVVVIDFDGKEHPRAYLVDPVMVPRLSENTHLRKDKVLFVEGQNLPALCVYSGNLFKYDPTIEGLPQFLNQLSTYLAKHLIFLKTRMLHRLDKSGRPVLVKERHPAQPISPSYMAISKKYVWLGHWAGRSAPMTVIQHLRTIAPEADCWCNSGEPYGSCHRERELLTLPPRMRSELRARGHNIPIPA